MTTPPPPGMKGGPKGGPPKPGGPLAMLHGKPHMALMLGGAAVVVVFALVKRSSASTASTASTDTTGTSTGTATYDSTASDVYNSIETQLSQFQTQLDQLQNGMPSGTGSTTSGGASVPGGGTTTSPPPKRVINGGNPPRAGVPIKVAPPKAQKPLFSWLTVRRGQTLSGIAASHHESLQTLFADNPVYTHNAKYKGGNLIFAGDKVKVR